MNIEEKLEKLRRRYISIMPPHKLVEKGFIDLEEAFLRQPKTVFGFSWFLARPLVFASIAIFGFGIILFGTVRVAQGALPGDSLYPVKRLSEDLILAASGNRQSKVDRRAQEILELVKENEDPSLIKKAAQEYKKEVLATKKEFEKSGQIKGEFRKKLENQEKEFKRVIEESSLLEEDLEEALEASRKGQDKDKEEDQEENDKRSNHGKRKSDGRNDQDRSGSNSGDD